MSADDQKRISGEAAAELVEAGMVVGPGHGLDGGLVRQGPGRAQGWTSGACRLPRPPPTWPASWASRWRPWTTCKSIDLTVDGADEVGPGLSLIKGGGAALLREKLVWEASKRCVVIADAAKKVDHLGKFPLPIEVVRFGHVHTGHRLADIAAEFDLLPPRLRMADRGIVRHRRRQRDLRPALGRDRRAGRPGRGPEDRHRRRRPRPVPGPGRRSPDRNRPRGGQAGPLDPYPPLFRVRWPSLTRPALSDPGAPRWLSTTSTSSSSAPVRGGVRAARLAAMSGAKGRRGRGVPGGRHLRDPRLRAQEVHGLRQRGARPS